MAAKKVASDVRFVAIEFVMIPFSYLFMSLIRLAHTTMGRGDEILGSNFFRRLAISRDETERAADPELFMRGSTYGKEFEKLFDMVININQARTLLEELRNELQDLSALAEGDRATVELDQQSVGRLSRMDALQRQAMAQAAQRARERNLQRIDAAFRRLADDEYGYCVSCDEEIAEKRLLADPAASHCVRCAQ